MMLGVIVTQVMMMADVRRFRIAYDDSQSSVDRSEHEARGNKSAETQQSEDERGGPVEYATASQPFRRT
jgi:hypothetical protein